MATVAMLDFGLMPIASACKNIDETWLDYRGQYHKAICMSRLQIGSRITLWQPFVFEKPEVGLVIYRPLTEISHRNLVSKYIRHSHMND